MPPKDFKSPRHVETHAYIFDKRTGEILATETRWTDEGTESAGAGVSRDLLHTIASDSGRTPKDLDVLVARPRAAHGPLRVDVTKKKVVTDRTSTPAEVVMPDPIRRP
jgi:hypothetical protein